MKLHCPECGGNDLEIAEDADDSIVSCGSCGAKLGRWGDVKAAALEATGGKVSEEFGNALKDEFGDDIEVG